MLCLSDGKKTKHLQDGRDYIVVRFTTTYAISAYHHYRCEFEPCSLRGILDTTL